MSYLPPEDVKTGFAFLDAIRDEQVFRQRLTELAEASEKYEKLRDEAKNAIVQNVSEKRALDDQTEDLSRQVKEFEDYKSKEGPRLVGKAHELANRESELASSQAQFAQDVKVFDDELDRREAVVGQRESRVSDREVDVTNRELKVFDREERVKAKEAQFKALAE